MEVSTSKRLSIELDTFGLTLCHSEGSRSQRILNKLHLHRRYQSSVSVCKYCDFKGTLRDVQAHMKECLSAQVQCSHCCKYCTQRSLSKHEKACDFRKVSCSIPGCATEYRKRDEAEHFDKCRVEHMKAVADLRDQLVQAKADYQQVQDQLQKEQKQLQRVQDQLQKEKEKPDPEELWLKLEHHEKKLEYQEQKIDYLEHESTKQQEAIEGQDVKIKEQDSRIKDLEAESAAKEKRIQDLLERIEELQEKIGISTRRECDGKASEFMFEIPGYRERRETGLPWTSKEVNTREGHKFILEVGFGKSALHWKLHSVKSEVDDQLQWPIQKCVLFTLINSMGRNNEDYYRQVSWEKPQQKRELVNFLSLDGQPDNSKISLKYSKVPFFLCKNQLRFKLLVMPDSA